MGPHGPERTFRHVLRAIELTRVFRVEIALLTFIRNIMKFHFDRRIVTICCFDTKTRSGREHKKEMRRRKWKSENENKLFS